MAWIVSLFGRELPPFAWALKPQSSQAIPFLAYPYSVLKVRKTILYYRYEFALVKILLEKHDAVYRSPMVATLPD